MNSKSSGSSLPTVRLKLWASITVNGDANPSTISFISPDMFAIALAMEMELGPV
jgi:hypothetical protein